MTINIRLFQINEERDVNKAARQGYEYMQATGIDESIYDMTWAGQFDTHYTDMQDALEDLYARFQSSEQPHMQISDVVEVEAVGGSEFYYTDADGFHEIEFESSLAEKKYQQVLDVVLVEPGRTAKRGKMDASLESMQQYVGGFIEVVYPFEAPACIVCGEESKLQGLPLNRGLKGSDGELYDIICGNFFLCSCKGENLTSLDKEELQKYTDLFKKPERFFRTADGIKSVPYDVRENRRHR